MSTRNRNLSKTEIDQAFAEGTGTQLPPILTVQQLAVLLQVSPKTVYEWIAKGRLDGAFRKRGKHHLIWRDRALDLLFNGAEWPHEKRTRTNPGRPVHDGF
jgi:excisionase family DNA binding protein